MNTRNHLLPTVLAATLAVSTAARADDLDLSARLVVYGDTKPAVLVTVNKKVKKLELHLKSDDGSQVDIEKKSLPLGKQVALEWKGVPGKHDYSGQIIVQFAGSDTEVVKPLKFKVEVMGQFAIDLKKEDLDLKEKTLTTRVDCEVDSIDLEVDGEDGVLAKINTPFHGAAPNTPLTIKWDQKPGNVMRLVIKPRCANGVTRQQEFFPWDYPVPHDEINFDSGSDEIPDSDKPKLETAYVEVAKALKKFSRWGKPSLYVAGHTDSVAGRDYNRDLSNRRARSIARYFKSKGLNVDVYYIGFGEGALLVPTPDETPEPRNRRAEYIISVNEPEMLVDGVKARWNKAQ